MLGSLVPCLLMPESRILFGILTCIGSCVLLMIGVGFKLDLDWNKLGHIARVLAVRYGIAAILALCYWFLLPFDRTVRLSLVILAVSPIGSAVPGFTEEMKGDAGLSCSINSLSILISIITIVTLLVTML